MPKAELSCIIQEQPGGGGWWKHRGRERQFLHHSVSRRLDQLHSGVRCVGVKLSGSIVWHGPAAQDNRNTAAITQLKSSAHRCSQDDGQIIVVRMMLLFKDLCIFLQHAFSSESTITPAQTLQKSPPKIK